MSSICLMLWHFRVKLLLFLLSLPLEASFRQWLPQSLETERSDSCVQRSSKVGHFIKFLALIQHAYSANCGAVDHLLGVLQNHQSRVPDCGDNSTLLYVNSLTFVLSMCAGIREVVLCKDTKGKCGLAVKSISKVRMLFVLGLRKLISYCSLWVAGIIGL